MSWLLIILGGAAAAAVILAVSLLWGCVLTPVKSGDEVELRLVVTASGHAAELEHILTGLDWLRDNGFLTAPVELEDAGMESEAIERAGLLAHRLSRLNITVCGGRDGY